MSSRTRTELCPRCKRQTYQVVEEAVPTDRAGYLWIQVEGFCLNPLCLTR